MSVMHLNHPKTIPPHPQPQSVEKLFFHKTSLWCLKA